jgi:hypothetical protein
MSAYAQSARSFKAAKPKWQPMGTFPCYCFANDYVTGEIIIINTWCSMEGCQECIPEWWMAI